MQVQCHDQHVVDRVRFIFFHYGISPHQQEPSSAADTTITMIVHQTLDVHDEAALRDAIARIAGATIVDE